MLPLPLASGTFTYAVPEPLAAAVRVGCRVVVPFGRRKFYTGVVTSLCASAPEGVDVKELAVVLDEGPVVVHPQLRLWQWVADYYMCAPGEVMDAAMPAGLKPRSETAVELNPDYEAAAGEAPWSDVEVDIVQLLDHEQKPLSIADLERRSGHPRLNATVERLLRRGAVMVSERLAERYRARKEVWLALADPSTEGLRRAFEAVKGAPRQETALLALQALAGPGAAGEVSRNALIEAAPEATPAVLRGLEQKGIVQIYRKEVNRFRYSGLVDPSLPVLSQAQAAALNQVHSSWTQKGVTLLHGVTASGKTEIYMHLIDYVLRQRRQALMLVPEIALTSQISDRLQRVFGDRVVVYHSKFTDNERVDLWRSLLRRGERGEPCVVLGARSALFLPFRNLGLVIVDEEHDSSYRQADPAPRYNARDTAIMLAWMHGAKTLLGSATPAVDTYSKALSGKYGLVKLAERYDGAALPPVTVVDMEEARARGQVGGALSARAVEVLRSALDAGRQGIVFINRRGYAPMAVCRMCGHVPRCEHCDVALTYHQGADRLVCHYCGASYPLNDRCPACHEHAVHVVGYGTERVEEDLAAQFPGVSVARMDLDTTRAKEGHMRLIDRFSQGADRLLVGTQMVTKGLDFKGVGAVVVVNADAVLHRPDYRATERAFQMTEQVAGRAGRRQGDTAQVVVQTSSPDHKVFGWLAAHDYQAFYDDEIGERRDYLYPPYGRLIYITLRHSDRRLLEELAEVYARPLRQQLGEGRVLGPQEPDVARVRALWIRRIMVKAEASVNMGALKALLRAHHDNMLSTTPALRQARVHFDVDP